MNLIVVFASKCLVKQRPQKREQKNDTVKITFDTAQNDPSLMV